MDTQDSQSVNPLLARIQMPGETFTLPSGGLFYEDGVIDPSVKNAEIHVRPMTALDEIVMKSPDLLFSGQAVNQVFARCIPQILNPSRLLTKDVDFLLACLRKVSYGDILEVAYTHDCKNAKEHSYQLDIAKFVRESKRIDPTTIEVNFSVEFPNGQTAQLRPVTFENFINLMQTINAADDGTPEMIRDQVVSGAAGLIRRVDDTTDPAMITEWLAQVPSGYITMINNKVDEGSGWGTDFTAKVRCLDCGEMVEISAPLNPLAFFT